MLGVIRFHLTQRDSSRRLTAFFLMLSLVMSSIAMVYSAQSFRDRIDAVRASDSDNAGWLISQLDVDHKALALAIDRMLLAESFPRQDADGAGLDQVRLRFDIFYSRVNTVLASLQREPITALLKERLIRLDMTRDDLAAEIDTLPEDDLPALLDFAASVERAGTVVRDITTLALQFHVSQSDLVRDMERSLLKRFWIQSLVLLALMIVSAVLAVRLWRELEARTVMMERALATVSKVFDTSLSAVVIADMYGRILMANPAASHIFGVPANQMEGLLIEEVMVPQEQRLAHRTMLEKHRTTGHRKMIGAGPVRLKAIRMDNSPFDAEVAIAEDQDLDGRPILIGFIRDISDIVAAEEKLRDARDEAQRHASAKTMFLATMSHEMRTPLHGVIAALDLIDERTMDSETRHLLQTARDCGGRALEQVNDVLQLTRLGESNLGAVAFSPVAVAQDIIRELTPIAAARGTRLELVLEVEEHAGTCLGLANAFSGALYNLAGNAVKFTEQGIVVISLTFRAPMPDQIHLKVAVTDTGIGIAPEDQSRIFAEFETLGGLSTGRESGTGLGLPIARLAVARMGGTLGLRSTPGSGSTFSFEITLSSAEDPSDIPSSTKPVPQGTHTGLPARVLDVLVVDDNSINVSLMSKMITRLGHRPTQAKNGLEAVAAASMHGYDVILMDVSMPVMDGREATLQIRGGGPSAGAAIIGVTAFSESERLADLQAAGMNAVLTKPVDTAALATAMAGVLEEQTVMSHDAPVARQGQCEDALHNLTQLLGAETARKYLTDALQDVDTRVSAAFTPQRPLDQVADLLHGAVGSTAVVGLSRLSIQLRKAEDAARADDHAAMADHHAQIARIIAEEKEKLKAALAEALQG
ncbi:MAG: response regulator [Rhodobacterales bacterium]|nr:response regulator [Rhodobacterales bacterium]